MAAIKALAEGMAYEESFICGRGPFMTVVRAALQDIVFPRRQRMWNGRVAARLSGADRTVRVEVELDGERHCFDWPSDRRLLDVLTGNGLAAPASCGEGICAACECQVVEGEVRMAGNLVLTDEDLANGYVLACQAVPVSDLVRISYD